MDYRTLFLTYLASLMVYTAFASLLAERNRKTRGLMWIAASLVIAVIKYTLQGLEGHIPTVLSSLVANELYLLSFTCQLLGLRWYITRVPLQQKWPLWAVGSLAALYAVLYQFRVPYIANLMNVPVILILAGTAGLLLARGRGLFHTVSRWTAFFVLGQMAVSIYRNILTNLYYARPWLVIEGQHDKRWLYSFMAMMALTTCVIMCSFWFFVVELQRELIQQSRTDALTGALNRRALFEEAQREVARAHRHGETLCLLLFDIDDFKRFNDTFGHAAGDAVLQRVVSEVNAGLRSQDRLARTGGEEFTILLPRTSCPQAQLVGERLRCAVEALSIEFNGQRVPVTISVGIAPLLPTRDASLEGVMHAADAAMYKAKHSGKNRVVTVELPPSAAAVDPAAQRGTRDENRPRLGGLQTLL